MATGVFRPDTAEAAAAQRAAAARAGVIPVAGPPQPGRRAANVVGQAPVAPPVYRPAPVSSSLPIGFRTPEQAEIGSGGRVQGTNPQGQFSQTLNQILAGVPASFWGGGSTATPSTNVPGGGGGGTGGGSSVGGGGGFGGGGGAASGAAPVDSSIWADLMNEFGRIRAAEEERIRRAGSDLASALSQIDPMAVYRWNPATITIPEAATVRYLQSIGASPEQAQAVRQLGQELMGASQADIGQYAAGVQQAITNQRLAQQAVGQTMTADALNRLALEAMAAQFGIRSAEASEKKADRDAALRLALEYGKLNRSGSGASVSAPQISYSSITLPNGQVVQIPSNYFQA